VALVSHKAILGGAVQLRGQAARTWLYFGLRIQLRYHDDAAFHRCARWLWENIFAEFWVGIT
jgi:hypothetical protein